MRRARSMIESLEKRVLLAVDPLVNQIPIRYLDGVAIADIIWDGKPVEMHAGRWMVQFDGYGGYLPDQVQQARQVVEQPGRPFQISHHLGADGLFLLTAPMQADPQDLVAQLSLLPGFVAVEPDFHYTLSLTPNDPSFGLQWGLNNTGQSGGASGVDVRAVSAWNTTTGSEQVVVAIVDSGIDYNHPDIAANMWANSLEIPGNGIDDDGNGYIDDVYGWDFYGNGTSPGPGDSDPMDQNNHGTHVAGTVSARGNNSIGVTGVAWNVKLMALKIGGSGNSVSGSAAVGSMNYALAMKNRVISPVNVKVTNHSWGGGGFSATLNTAFANHASAGILAAAAAGNGGADFIGDNNDSIPVYPASYNQPNIIAVANLTRFNARAGSSNYGPTSVDLAAPGTEIYSTVRVSSGSYAYFNGTSMATPHVAGAVALLASHAPSANFLTIRDAILQTTDAVPDFAGMTVTGGRLNVNAALAQLAIPVAPSAPDLAPGSDTGISNTDNITRDNTPTFQGFAQSGQTIRIYASGMLVGQAVVPGSNFYQVTTTEMADGVYNFTATVGNDLGESAHSLPLGVTIDTVAPVVNSSVFGWLASPHTLAIAFSKNVAESVQNADFSVQNTDTLAIAPLNHSYIPANDNVTLTFASASIFPDGRYKLRVHASGPGGGIEDLAGNALAADFADEFFFLIGDANRDGRVDLSDFNRVAANFGESPRNFSQGDFNYDGVVNLMDFNLLAGRFGTDLFAAPDATGASSGSTGQSGKAAPSAGKSVAAGSSFSTTPIRTDSQFKQGNSILSDEVSDDVLI